MGWYGDYDNITGVISETKQGIENKKGKILFEKSTKTKSLIIFEIDKKIYADYIIFNATHRTYKPLSWIDCIEKIPTKYKLHLFKNASNTEKSIYRDYHEKLNNQLPKLKQGEAIVLKFINKLDFVPYDFLKENPIVRITKRKNSFLLNDYARLTNFKNYYNKDYFEIVK